MNRFTDIDTQDDLTIDPREHVIAHYGHGSIYSTHLCPICEVESPCRTQLCKQPFTIECLPCANRQLLEDTEEFAKEARKFLKDASTPELMWKASVLDGKLKGLAERASEILKREVNG